MIYYYYTFAAFCILLYFVVTDESFAFFINFLLKRFKFNYEKTKWWLFNDPSNPLVKYMMWRKALKMAKELEKEFREKKFQDNGIDGKGKDLL